MGRDVISLILMLIIVSILPLGVQSRERRAADNANVVRDTQLFLSLSGFYTGTIDGQCNAQTQNSIEKYKATLMTSPVGPSCSVQFLENLNDRLRDSLSQRTAGGYNIDSLPAAISKIEGELTVTKNSLRGLNEGISTHFITLANNMNSMWITTLVTGLSIFVAIAIGTINIFLKKKAEDLYDEIQRKHKELLAESTTKVSEMITRSEEKLSLKILESHEDLSEKVYELLTNIYVQLAGYSFNLYKDIRDPAGDNKKLYDSYLNIAVTMAKQGFDNSVTMQNLLGRKKEDPTEVQKIIIDNAINNYVFYLSSRGREQDNELVARALPQLESIIANGQTIDRWYDYIETLAWAELHLNRKTAQQTKDIIQQLIADKAVPGRWKQAVKERYEFYNKAHPDKEGVNLQL